MSNEPLISIIIAVHATPIDFLESCITSIQKQTYSSRRTETVICETPSTPEYSAKLKHLLETVKEPKVRYCRSEVEGDLAVARNTAVSQCEGDWVLALDSDDKLESDAINSLVMGMSDDTVMVYGDHARMSANLAEVKYVRSKSVYHRLLQRYSLNPLYNPLYSSIFVGPGEIIKKDALIDVGGYTKQIGERPPVWIKLFEMAGTKGVSHVPRVVYKYRENPNGIVSLRRKELQESHENTFLSALRKQGCDVFKVLYEGPFEPLKVKHFSSYDGGGRIVMIPYLDYLRRSLIF